MDQIITNMDRYGKGDNVVINTQIYTSDSMTNNRVSTFATQAGIDKTALNLQGYLTNYMDDTGKILGCDIMGNYNWLKTPSKKGIDAMTINWDSTYFEIDPYCLESLSTHNFVTNTDTGLQEYFGYENQIDLAISDGVGWDFSLIKSDLEASKQENLGGFYNVAWIPAYEMYADDYVITTFEIDYIHNDFDSPIEFVNQDGIVATTGNNLSILELNLRYMSFN